MTSISPGADIIEELVVAAADSIPEGKEDGLWRAFRRAFAANVLPVSATPGKSGKLSVPTRSTSRPDDARIRLSSATLC